MKIDGWPFGEIAGERVVCEGGGAVAFLDGFPVTEGHTLVVPRRVVASLDELSVAEEACLWEMVRTAREILRTRYRPDAFNIGVNDGPAAGQTVQHAHIHIIPRRLGDQPDPRGGVRLIFPAKARYWQDD